MLTGTKNQMIAPAVPLKKKKSEIVSEVRHRKIIQYKASERDTATSLIIHTQLQHLGQEN